MLICHRKKYGVNFYAIWFADRLIKKSGVFTYREYMGKKPEGAKEYNTLITDLTETEDEIKGHFSKSCKYKVNRAIREDISIQIIRDNEITDDIIDFFSDFFGMFWESKGTKMPDKNKLKEELNIYRELSSLSLGIAYVNGEKAVVHTHIKDESTARLLHSASLYRLQEDEEGNTRNLIGMANRLLHYEEMKYFKSFGIKRYDWGGAGLSEDVLNITEFKKSFGGEPVTYYEFEKVRGIWPKVYKFIIGIIGR